MTTTLEYPGGVPIVADFAVVGSADAEITGGSITHQILDGAPVYTLRPALPQTGTLHLLFASAQRAHAAKGGLTAAAAYVVTSTDSAYLPSRIIVRTVKVTQHPDANGVWTVLIDYEAVT